MLYFYNLNKILAKVSACNVKQNKTKIYHKFSLTTFPCVLYEYLKTKFILLTAFIYCSKDLLKLWNLWLKFRTCLNSHLLFPFNSFDLMLLKSIQYSTMASHAEF